MTQPSTSTIRAAVSQAFGVSEADMIGPCRKRSLTWARFAFTALARARTDRSYDHLGRALGNRDHTTMSSAESRGYELMACDPDFQEMFHAADKQIGGAA